jgi:hypothetical protein
MPGFNGETRDMFCDGLVQYSVGPLLPFMAELHYQVHHMIQTFFPNNEAVFQDDSASILTAGTVQSWFEEHEGDVRHHSWLEQSPDLYITEPLWSVLETKVKNRFPTPTSLKQLEDVLQEKWFKVPLETVQNLYEYIPSRSVAVLKTKGGPTPH